MNNTILITGSNGQLGNELRELAGSFGAYHFVFTDIDEMPITDEDVVEQTFSEQRPAFVINCAAYTAVDKAESDSDIAYLVNGTAVGILAKACQRYGAKLVHISTDYVFNGNASSPIKESDPVDPVNVYGASKLKGEELALEHDPGCIIIRTSWVYSYYGKNFVKTMMRLMTEKESIGVVNDQLGSPTYAADLASAIMQIISSGRWTPGIYHFSNEGVISWFDFANEIKNLTGAGCIINPLTTNEFPTPAKRPAYSAMDKSKIKSLLPGSLKNWKDSLRICVERLQQDRSS